MRRHVLLMLIENAVNSISVQDKIAKLEQRLKEFGWTNRKFGEAYDTVKSSIPKPKAGAISTSQFGGGSISKTPTKSVPELYADYLESKLTEHEPKEKIDFDSREITDADIPGHIPAGQFDDSKTGTGPKDKPISDESVIDALKMLAANLGPKGRDKTIVLAARLNIDSELIEGAGFGSLPPNYTDEDVWNILKISRKNGKQIPFIDHAWQPFYMEALEDLKELPSEVRDHIIELLTSSEPKETTYPVVNKDSMVDDPIRNKGIRKVYEAKLIDDLVIESADGINVISAGTKVRLI